MSGGLDEAQLKEFYQHVYPVEDIVQWLSYCFTDASSEDADQAAINRATGNFARREFCFTLLGDIFTRFRSYTSAAELRQELVKRFPEKIDVGAVYNLRPNQKQQAQILPLERELIFDIDMSDYDAVRSCCQGKSVCELCWGWMSCAAKTLAAILRDDFGFRYILPVFSGRRGIHLWVCDKRARKLADDERMAIVGYMTVQQGGNKTNVTNDAVNGRPMHPTLQDVQREILHPQFERTFLLSDPSVDANSVRHPKGAAVVFAALAASVKACNAHRKDAVARFHKDIPFEEGNTLDWERVKKALGPELYPGVLASVEFMLMYPRLDEHVSTHRDHLLKLPFCVHPGTGKLCCPLPWEYLDEFNPTSEAPLMEHLLNARGIEMRWLKPLRDMLDEMSRDPNENEAALTEA